MKTIKENKIKNRINSSSDSVEKLLNDLLDTNDFSRKQSARRTLVQMGKRIIPEMHKLLNSENDSSRMEAVKIVEMIADRKSIPFLIGLLGDTVFDIRWMAAEGLIKIGRLSICPLLKAVRDGKSSLIFNRGTHHILLSLLKPEEINRLKPFLQSLDNYHELGGTAPAMASDALKTVFSCNT